MNLSTHVPFGRRLRISVPAVAAALVVSVGGRLVTGGTAQAAAVAVPLGTAESFVVLAGAGITNTGPTVLTGDIGSFPNSGLRRSDRVTDRS